MSAPTLPTRPAEPALGRDRRGLAAWLAAADHKAIAGRLAVVAFFYFLVAGGLALTIRAELAATGMQFVTKDVYSELFTLHGSGMIYLFVAPFALALALYFVPLQVGAAEVSRPRLALAGLWLYIVGGVLMFGSFATLHGGANAAWVGTDPLSTRPWTSSPGMDLWMAGVMAAVGGMILIAGCVFFTILRRRAPGMTMLRLPVFCWAVFVTCLMVLAGFPALEVALTLQLLERNLPGLSDLLPPIAYQHLFWFYGHPVVYVMFFPFLGAVAEIIAVFSGRRFFGYTALVLSLLAFSALSMAVWGHHMLATGRVETGYFALTSTLLIIPAGVDYFDMIATMWTSRRIRLAVPMLFAVGFLLQFLIGGVTGIWVASPPLDYHHHDSYFVVAHFHYTLVAGSLFGLFAAVYFWFPKVTGVLLSERLGRWHFWTGVVGVNLAFFPMFLLGHDGMARRVADYSPGLGWEPLNIVSTVGAALIALSVLVFLVNVAIALAVRRPGGDDPWGGHTLEWATSSPPPRHNFTSPLPPIRSFAPLLDRPKGNDPDA